MYDEFDIDLLDECIIKYQLVDKYFKGIGLVTNNNTII